MVDLRINETLQTSAVRQPPLPFSRLVGAVSNCAYSVRLETAPTGGRTCLFIFGIHHNSLSGARCPAYDVKGNLPNVAQTASLRGGITV